MTDSASTPSRLWDSVLAEHGGHGDSESTLLPVGSAGVSGGDDELALDETATWRHRSSGLDSRSFRAKGLIGRGGMGEVLLAEQQRLGREVAVKVVAPERSGPAAIAAIQEEARLGGRLEHPNVVPVHDAGEDFVVMRRVRGRSLREVLAAGAELPESIDILRKVCEAVAFAHDRGIIHRDLKPANVMVGAFGEVLVTDWGLSLRLSERADGGWGPPAIAAEQAAAGTLAYLAPEMARADAAALGPATDVYQIGGILYRILAGHPPHAADDLRAALHSAAANAMPELVPGSGCPQRLIDWQRRAMATDPAARPGPLALRDGLSDWLHSVDAEQSALAAAERGDEHLAAAATAVDEAERYRAYEAAVATFETALDRWAECPPARAGLARARDGYLNAALANEDLVLAQCLAAGSQEAEAQLARTRYALDERRRHARQVRLGVGLLGLALVGVAAGLLVDAVHARGRAEAARRDEAAALIAAAEQRAGATSERAHVDRVQLVFRAAGLQPDDAAVGQAVRDAILDFGTWAVAQRRWDLAEAQARQAAWLGEDAAAEHITAQIATARAAAEADRCALIGKRRARLAEIIAVPGESPRSGSWHDRHAAEIASWDGGELAADLHDLAAHEDPLVRLVVADVLGRRPDLGGEAVLVGLLDDPRRMVVDQAWRSLARLPELASLSELRARLLAMEDQWRARALSADLADRLLPAEDIEARDDAARRRAARLALLAHRPARAIAHLAALAEPQRADRIERGRLQGWVLPDAAACAELAAALAAADPADPWAALLAVRAEHLSGGLLVADAVALAARLPGQEGLTADAPPAEVSALPEVYRPLLASAYAMRGPQEAAVALRVPVIAESHHLLLRIEAERRAGHDRIAWRLARVLAAQLPWDYDATLLRGETALAIGRIEEGFAGVHEAALLRPDRSEAQVALAHAARRRGDLAAALAAWHRVAAMGAAEARAEAGAWILLLEELHHQRPAPARMLAELGADSRSLARFLPLVVRRLCEADRHHDALHLLLAAEASHAGLHLREAFDTWCLSVPACRRAGWPGMPAGDLAALLVREALVALAEGRHSRGVELLATARSHAPAWSVPERLAVLPELLQAGASADAAERIEDLLEDYPALADRPRLRFRLQRWQAGLRAGLAGPGPVAPAQLHPQHPPLRPMPDARLHPEDHALLVAWWGRELPRLPRSAGLELVVGAWGATGPAPSVPTRDERGQWPLREARSEGPP